MVPTDRYDPHINALLDQIEQDWDKPEVNREHLVPYGLWPLDKALYGIDTINGEMILVLGEHKKRKTTLLLNILANIFTRETGKKPVTNVDTLESGMPPSRYRDALISIVASKYLIREGHSPTNCQMCGKDICKELGISPEFLRYNSRSRKQMQAIEYAVDTMRGWPLLIHGANPFQGDTRNLQSSVRAKNSRWLHLIHEEGVSMLVSDHVQQYSVGNGLEATDYERQLYAVSSAADIVAQWHVALFLISQVSLTSVRTGKMAAAGGNRGAQEANVVLGTDYTPGTGTMKISVLESRRSATFDFWHPIDDTSGAFYGKPGKYTEATEQTKHSELF